MHHKHSRHKSSIYHKWSWSCIKYQDLILINHIEINAKILDLILISTMWKICLKIFFKLMRVSRREVYKEKSSFQKRAAPDKTHEQIVNCIKFDLIWQQHHPSNEFHFISFLVNLHSLLLSLFNFLMSRALSCDACEHVAVDVYSTVIQSFCHTFRSPLFFTCSGKQKHGWNDGKTTTTTNMYEGAQHACHETIKW